MGTAHVGERCWALSNKYTSRTAGFTAHMWKVDGLLDTLSAIPGWQASACAPASKAMQCTAMYCAQVRRLLLAGATAAQVKHVISAASKASSRPLLPTCCHNSNKVDCILRISLQSHRSCCRSLFFCTLHAVSYCPSEARHNNCVLEVRHAQQEVRRSQWEVGHAQWG